MNAIRMTPAKDGVDPEYLGDGVYVQRDRNDQHQIWLTAEDGEQAYEAIALGRHEVAALLRYAKRVGLA